MTSADPRLMRRLPAEFAERARAVAAGEHQPAPARDAATVVLLRDAPGRGLEVYLLRRVGSMAFAGGMWVFPGGSVDPRDRDLDMWRGQPPDAWAPVLRADVPLARALMAAAVRETFEEAGVLLAEGDLADPGAERAALLDRSAAMADVAARNGLRLRADLLAPWAHWVTPEFEPRRFDTRFFVASLPEGQAPVHFTGESDRAEWVRPADAVRRHAAGELAMLPPTVFTLAELTEYAGVADVLAAASRREIRRTLPRVVVAGDDIRFLLPGEEGYPADPEPDGQPGAPTGAREPAP